ncbi:MAG: hypothetical protein AB2556_24995, partial [Candidatus Thiodiazotropha sp.]
MIRQLLRRGRGVGRVRQREEDRRRLARILQTPTLKVIPLGERVPDKVLADLKARAEACKAKLSAGKKGVIPDSEPAGTPDMPRLSSSATPDMP